MEPTDSFEYCQINIYVNETSVHKMKKNILFLSLLVILMLAGIFVKRYFYGAENALSLARSNVEQLSKNNEIRNGDLIFQTSLSGQSVAIQLATRSKFSHCGIIFKSGKDFYVFEAVQPVKTTPLDKWIARGQDGKYVIKRLKNADQILIPSTIEKMKSVGEKFNGKNYDLTFEWSDERVYCSELIWKIYQRSTGIEIGKLEKLSDFDLTDVAVKNIMKERYGERIPEDEIVISPVSIFESELLHTVKKN